MKPNKLLVIQKVSKHVAMFLTLTMAQGLTFCIADMLEKSFALHHEVENDRPWKIVDKAAESPRDSVLGII